MTIDARAKPRIGFIYAMAPIDFWYGWTDFDDFEKGQRDKMGEYHDQSVMIEFQQFIEAAKIAAVMVGWEGDIREGPLVSGLPCVGDPASNLMVAWKQSNNGDTFVASPIRLIWMEDERQIKFNAFLW